MNMQLFEKQYIYNWILVELGSRTTGAWEMSYLNLSKKIWIMTILGVLMLS